MQFERTAPGIVPLVIQVDDQVQSPMPGFYRMAELYFRDQAQMEQSLGSPAGKAVVADASQLATGGITIIVGTVDA